jgi:hypothetical protein
MDLRCHCLNNFPPANGNNCLVLGTSGGAALTWGLCQEWFRLGTTLGKGGIPLLDDLNHG